MDRDEARKHVFPLGDAKEQELAELGKRTAAAKSLTNEQLMETLKAKRLEREKAKQPTEPRPADRLKAVDPAILENRRTRGVPEPPDEPEPCAECGSDDHPMCPACRRELRPITSWRTARGQLPDRKCPSCDLTESAVIAKGQGALLYPTTGLKQSMKRYVQSAPTGSSFA